MEPTTTHSAGHAHAPRPQSFTGVVVGQAGKDTAVVRVDRYVKHPKYKKYRVRSKKYLVDDQDNGARVGDTVTIVATRPISKMKRFRIGSTVRTAAAAES
jgi:small subunit ribosomal protein S17